MKTKTQKVRKAAIKLPSSNFSKMAKEVQPAAVAESIEQPETTNWQPKNGYVGPQYDVGIFLDGQAEPIRPADFSDEQISAFIKAHPTRAWWFGK